MNCPTTRAPALTLDAAELCQRPPTLQGWGVCLEPLGPQHTTGLQACAQEDAQHQTWLTWIPHPDEVPHYIQTAQQAQASQQRCPWAVVQADNGRVLGTTSYHDIVPAAQRLEIGHTWYATSAQRSHVNTACKLLLMRHAFDTLGCAVVGWRTDAHNLRSQRAIERLGAHKDGVLRHHQARRDGSVRDTVMYSLLATEWPKTQARLLQKM